MSKADTDSTYYTLTQEKMASITLEKSKFIAWIFPAQNLSEIETKLAALKKEHAKANHICYAYKIGYSTQPQIFSTDDREPSGTAGLPIFNVLNQNALQDCGLAVIRYFGGIKLGVRGLIDAYTAAANLAVKNAEIIQKTLMQSQTVKCDYAQFDYLCYLVEKHCGIISNQQFLSEIECNISFPKHIFQTAIELLYEKKIIH